MMPARVATTARHNATLVAALIMLAIPGRAVSQATYAEHVERHQALVAQAKAVLMSTGDLKKARSYLEEASRIGIDTPQGRLRLRSVEGDLYYAWILCRDPATQAEGAARFRTILVNDELSDDQASLTRQELGKCGASEPGPAQKWTTVIFRRGSVMKGVQYSEPLRLGGPSRLPLLPWSNATQGMTAVRNALGMPLQELQQRPFIIAGRRPSGYLEGLAATVLRPYYDYFTSRLGADSNSDVIYALVASNSAELSTMTRRLYQWVPTEDHIEFVIAYSDPQSATMMAICGPNASNCTSFAHELFHLLNNRVFEDAPWWLYEGMAELFESGDIRGREFQPKVGWRKTNLSGGTLDAATMRRLLQTSKNDPMLRDPPFAATAMARVSFFCQFLHRRDKLWAIYDDLRQRGWKDAASDPAGIKAIEKHLEKPLDSVAADFSAWLAKDVLPVKPSTQRP